MLLCRSIADAEGVLHCRLNTPARSLEKRKHPQKKGGKKSPARSVEEEKPAQKRRKKVYAFRRRGESLCAREAARDQLLRLYRSKHSAHTTAAYSELHHHMCMTVDCYCVGTSSLHCCQVTVHACNGGTLQCRCGRCSV